MPGKQVEVRTQVPAHGGGRLQVGNPGNAGGGRPASAIRLRARQSFDQRIGKLEEFADGKVTIPIQQRCPKCGHEPDRDEQRDILDLVPSMADMLKAIDMLGKYGLGQAKELSDEVIRAKVAEMILRIRASFPEAEADHILSIIRPVWRHV